MSQFALPKFAALDRQGMNLFVYGTLMAGQSNHRIMAPFVDAGHAELRYDNVVVQDSVMLDIGGLPAMYVDRLPFASGVRGQIWGVSPLALEYLDRFEGHPHFYARSRLGPDRTNLSLDLDLYFYQGPLARASTDPFGIFRGRRVDDMLLCDWRDRASPENDIEIPFTSVFDGGIFPAGHLSDHLSDLDMRELNYAPEEEEEEMPPDPLMARLRGVRFAGER